MVGLSAYLRFYPCPNSITVTLLFYFNKKEMWLPLSPKVDSPRRNGSMESFVGLSLLTIIILSVGVWLFDRRTMLIRQYLIAARQERDAIREELQLMRAQRDTIGSNVGEGILLIDADERIIFINAVAKRILDIRSEDKLTLSQINWWHDLQPLVRDVIEHRAELLGQTIVKDERAFQVNACSLPKDSHIVAIVVINEVTELQRLGRMRRDFVANISHELRTPVTSMQLLVETLAKKIPANDPIVADLLSKQQEQVSVLHQLAEEMMGLALIESGQTPIRLIETRVIDSLEQALATLQTMAERKKIQVDLQITPDLCALADPEGTRKVFNNLLHNAIKFTPAQGKITIRATQFGDNVQVQITDTGMGIPPRDLPRIFERFYQVDRARTASQSRGTGLGLAIAKHIIEGHGGKIWAESVEGKGSTFYFTLPACGESSES